MSNSRRVNGRQFATENSDPVGQIVPPTIEKIDLMQIMIQKVQQGEKNRNAERDWVEIRERGFSHFSVFYQ